MIIGLHRIPEPRIIEDSEARIFFKWPVLNRSSTRAAYGQDRSILLEEPVVPTACLAPAAPNFTAITVLENIVGKKTKVRHYILMGRNAHKSFANESSDKRRSLE